MIWYCILTSPLVHNINATIFFPVLILANAGFWIFHFDLFLQIKDLELYFDFYFKCNFLLKNNKHLQDCKMLYTQKYCEVNESGSTPVLVNKTTFTHTLKCWSPPSSTIQNLSFFRSHFACIRLACLLTTTH